MSTPDRFHVALLRGINVGGKNKLAMRDLIGLFSTAGCTEVKTYIQSGNVVFRASAKVTAKLAATIQAGIERDLGLRVPIVLRSAEELEQVAQGNPFMSSGETGEADTNALHVMFLAGTPTAAAVASLDPQRSPPDEFKVVGRDVYLRCPGGLADTKLSNDYFDRKLATTSTGRNWRTILKLLEMTRG